MEVSLDILNKIFTDSFGSNINLTFDSNKDNIDEWDSFNHLNLVVELNDQLNISFTTKEVEEIISIKRLIEVLKTK